MVYGGDGYLVAELAKCSRQHLGTFLLFSGTDFGAPFDKSHSSAITVNTEQSTVQGVLSGEQIDNIPVNGHSFFDLAQLEPGVQMQDGQNFDPTKVGYNSLSINGDYGRMPRIEVDGLDVSDETVGTTTQNIALSSIQEFNIGRSSFDISSEITGTGTVNLATRSGTNEYHGQAFYPSPTDPKAARIFELCVI